MQMFFVFFSCFVSRFHYYVARKHSQHYVLFLTCLSPPPLIDLLFRMLISQEGNVWCSPVEFALSGPTSHSCQPVYC